MPIRNHLGFDRKLKLAWLDAAAGLAGKSALEAKSHLDVFLTNDISGVEARHKANDALRRLWVTCEEHRLTQDARQLFGSASRDARVCLHYGMSLMAAPFFRDVVHFMGRLISLQAQVSVAQVRTRIYEKWGERSTLHYAVARIFASLNDWGVLKPLGKGDYEAIPLTIPQEAIASWLLAAAAYAHPARQIPLEELLALPVLFPFEIQAWTEPFTKPALERSEGFEGKLSERHALLLVQRSEYFDFHREGLDRTYVRVNVS